MKRTITLVSLLLCSFMAFAQSHRSHVNLDKTFMSPAESRLLKQQMDPKANYLYRLNNYYSDDQYTVVQYSFGENGRCNAIYTQEGYTGSPDSYKVYDSVYYDNAGHISRVSGFQFLNGSWVNVYYCDYTYNAQGLLATRKNYNLWQGSYQLGGTYYFSYNNQGQLIEKRLDFAGGDFDKTVYTYQNNLLVNTLYSYANGFGGWDPYERWTFEYDNNGLIQSSNGEVFEDGAWALSGYEIYEYYEDGNVYKYSSFNAAGRELKRRELEYESRNVADTYIPSTPEEEAPDVYANTKLYNLEHYYAVDVDLVLQYVCDYNYEYDNFSAIANVPAVKLSVYPNPATRLVNIEGQDGDCIVRLFDMNGRMVKMQRVEGTSYSMDLSGVAAGNYIIRVDGATPRASQIVVTQ